ncbi:MAG TPA: RNA methyltransferase [Pseudomonadales bacterium]|nr:RNA methyltransferase [Pseudomonadales bacterium]
MASYQEKKAFYDRVITIYGRKPVLEALQDTSLPIHRLHLADSNKPAGIVLDMLRLAEKRGIDVVYHNKQALSRISRNGKQDQGVAADIVSDLYADYSSLTSAPADAELLALDGITNPQNLGMIIRSVCASGMYGILLPEKGCCDINPLVIKASVGTLFRTRIFRCKDLAQTLADLQRQGWQSCVLSSHATTPLGDFTRHGNNVYVLGNETEGVRSSIMDSADQQLIIPMANDVESLNVAVTASLIAFRKQLLAR